MNRTVRNAQVVLQKARLMVAQQKNAYDLRGCINALDSCMQDDFVCGTDYENCLDPTGKYIVNGEVVIGSAPGYLVSENGATSGSSDMGGELLAPTINPTTGLYETWKYNDTTAWNSDGNLKEYIASNISKSAIKETDNNMVKYLQYKIGYIEANKAYGMCSSVLNKCQNYTYDGKDYVHDNQVIREYLARTLTQIKATQDEIISSYAENCISDVSSCLSSNNYSNATTKQANYAINACKAQIVTCMSVNGDATQTPTPANMQQWIANIMGVLNAEDTGNGGNGDNGGDGGDQPGKLPAETKKSLSVDVSNDVENLVNAGELEWNTNYVECDTAKTVTIVPDYSLTELGKKESPNFAYGYGMCEGGGANCVAFSDGAFTITPEQCESLTALEVNGETCKNCNTINVQYDGLSFVSGKEAYCSTDRVTSIAPEDYLYISDPEGASDVGFPESDLSTWVNIRIEKNGTTVYEGGHTEFNDQLDPKYCDGQHTIHVSI
jgi:hypothetical protein